MTKAMERTRDVYQFHFVNLRQWYMSGDDPEAFRQLTQRGDHRFTDGFLPECYTDGCEYRWIQGMVDSLLWGDELHYAVDVDGKAAGCLNVSRCGGVYSRTGILRLILLPEYCGQGIGSQAVSMAVRQALQCYHDGEFVHKGSFERLQASVIGDNPAAVRVLEKNGFAYEGTVRNGVRKGLEVMDEKVYGIFLPEPSFNTPALTAEMAERINLIRKFFDEE